MAKTESSAPIAELRSNRFENSVWLLTDYTTRVCINVYRDPLHAMSAQRDALPDHKWHSCVGLQRWEVVGPDGHVRNWLEEVEVQ